MKIAWRVLSDARKYWVQMTIGFVGVVIATIAGFYLPWALRSLTQDTFLFDGSVYDNIAYGWKDASRDDVIAAAKAAKAHDFIVQMEQGYDTIIGERGVRLSGGQKQRLSIARAILRNAPILILDEATSSLDARTEQEIQQALDVISQNRTTLVIAHRLSTIRHADLIVVLEGEGVAETGTHEELIRRSGLYARLYVSQAS